MNKITIAAGAVAVAVVLAGCGPKLAQVPYGSEEARWQKILRENYSGYEAPRTAPPAIRDNVSPRLIEEEQARKNEQNGFNPPPPADAPADDPALMVDKAAEKPAVQEQAPAREPDKKPAEKPAEKPAAKADKSAKTAEKTADKIDKSAKPAEKPADKTGKSAKPAEKSEAPKGATVYVVQPKDTLGDLAKRFYGDAKRRDVIVRANPELKKNPDFLKPGMKLVIPKICVISP